MVLKYKDMHAFDNYKTMKIIYSMYRAGEVSVHRACCERATQPYSLGREGTIYPGSSPASVTTRSPRMVTECLLTRSVLIKMCRICTLYLQSVNFMQMLIQSILSFKLHKCFCFAPYVLTSKIRKLYICLMHILSKSWHPSDGPEVHVHKSSFSCCFLCKTNSMFKWTTLSSFNRINLQMTTLW